MASNQDELYGQLLPLAEGYALLPRVGVLEVQSMGGVNVSTAGPGWFLGFAARQDDEIPVVSLEAMAGADVPVRSRRSRLAVLKSLGHHLEAGLLTLVIQGQPELVQINAQVLQKRECHSREAEVALTGVTLANREAFIPDLDHIERRVSEALGRITDAVAGTDDWEPGASLAGSDPLSDSF